MTVSDLNSLTNRERDKNSIILSSLENTWKTASHERALHKLSNDHFAWFQCSTDQNV